MPPSSPHACSDSLTREQIDALWKVDGPVEGEAKLKNAVAEYPGSVDELRTQITRSLGLQRRLVRPG